MVTAALDATSAGRCPARFDYSGTAALRWQPEYPGAAMSKPLAALFLTIASLAGGAYGQDAQPTFRVGADLVVLDLVAVDRAGRVVTDLKVSEIEVREDGRVQTIAFLQLAGASPLDSGDALSAQAGATTSLTAAPPPTAGTAGLHTGPPAHLALVLDVLSTPPTPSPACARRCCGSHEANSHQSCR